MVSIHIDEASLLELLAEYLDSEVFSNGVEAVAITHLTYLDAGGLVVEATFGEDDGSGLAILHDIALTPEDEDAGC